MIFPSLLRHANSLVFLDLSFNDLRGSFPHHTVEKAISLVHLDLSYNHLERIVPKCLENFQSLQIKGTVPDLSSRFVGFPAIDLSHNKFSGPLSAFPSNITTLNLSNNSFHGSVSFLCTTRTIPRCLNNLTSMAEQRSPIDATIKYLYVYSYIQYNNGSSSGYGSEYVDNVHLMLKKMGLVYSKNLGLVKAMDLSSNNLTGGIPVQLTNLTGLIGLNLSGNFLTGTIPREIGKLKQLDSLDLSRNQLSGGIPSSLSQLTHLGTLDLSHNSLSGRIPSGTQLQSFDKATYEGNQDLCGVPLPKKCPGDEEHNVPEAAKTNTEHNVPEAAKTNTEHSWFCYESAGIGFVLSFSGVCGLLLLNVCWKHSYTQYIDELGARIYLRITGGKPYI
ncbi:hypothetical protein FEM48_Zijuj03G0166500 [Ziziphus jujuba var. spinosa]|uniref:Receptor-like protein EIX2 n=1 Tax=Ziziphus jujuba var. spinosa TaxID=714518 RepID=A0A978VRF6_ZIZJJ|nr:hypothetical protein FEM48_Zijuj03G0166500 [Ziziphus jujuba var. spinosa]